MKQTENATPYLIQVIRQIRLGLHLMAGAATVACIFPLITSRQQRWLNQRWSRQLLDILAVRLDAQLTGACSGSLIVANHISWLDIYALGATRQMIFVSKAEVRHWPVIGWLAASAGTIFLRRGSRGHARSVNAQINGLLQADRDVAIFPEGTTTDGSYLLNFHGALLQPAVDAGRPIQPVALSYHEADGRRSLAPAYAGETTMHQCLKAVLACRRLTVRLRPTPPIDPQTRSRRELALAAQCAIADSLGLPTASTAGEAPPT